jgi:hypothetical protein
MSDARRAVLELTTADCSVYRSASSKAGLLAQHSAGKTARRLAVPKAHSAAEWKVYWMAGQTAAGLVALKESLAVGCLGSLKALRSDRTQAAV